MTGRSEQPASSNAVAIIKYLSGKKGKKEGRIQMWSVDTMFIRKHLEVGTK